MSIAADVDSQPLGAGVDDRSADAVQAAGHLVTGVLAAELAAGVQDGVDNGDSRQAGIGLNVHGDAAAVIGDLNDVVLQDLDLDVVAVARQSLIDGVVHDLVDQMVQAPLTGGADIHAGALPDCLQTLQDLDLAGVILMVGSGLGIGACDDFFCHFLSPFVRISCKLDRSIVKAGPFALPFGIFIRSSFPLCAAWRQGTARTDRPYPPQPRLPERSTGAARRTG